MLTRNVFQSSMRFLTSLYTTIDPIGILQNYVANLYRRIQQMEDNIIVLKGSIAKLTFDINKNNDEMEKEMKLAAKAKENSDAIRIEVFIFKNLSNISGKLRL